MSSTSIAVGAHVEQTDPIAEAQARGPCKVLVVSVFGDGRTVVRAIERGADGYLLKGSAGPEAVAAIRSSRKGRSAAISGSQQ